MNNKLKICENVYIDKIYIINLEFQKDLKKQITNQMIKYNILDYVIFIDAVYRPDRPSYGCSLSHHKALQDMKKNNYDACMILEDDCVLTEFPFKINDKVPEDWAMLYPGYLAYDEISYKYNNSFLRLIDARSTHSYIVNKKYLNYMIRMTLVENIPIDMRFVCPIQNSSPCYGFYPIKAYQLIHKSTIGYDETNWNIIMDKKAEKCFNNIETEEKIKLSNLWFNHRIEMEKTL